MDKREIPAFDIDEKGNLPIWIQLRDRFAYLISSGYYKPEDQLPSVRKLAAELRISYNTVSKAYMALEREGYVATRHGSGAYVRGVDVDSGITEVDVMAEEFVKACMEKGLGYEDVSKCVSKAVRRLKRS